MIVFSVHLHIRPECVEAFKAITLANLEGSRQEPGCRRFEALQHEDDPTRFILFEAWADAAAQDFHRNTPHYQAWKDQVEDMQVERRHAIRYAPLAAMQLG